MDDLGGSRRRDTGAGQPPGDPLAEDAPGYLTGTDAAPARGRSLPWLLTTAAVVLVLGVAAVLVTTGARTGGGPSRVDGPIVEQGYAAPWDGKASLRLPVTVTPNRDLVDGQEVVVTASGFAPGEDLGVVMCTNRAAFEGIAACDINTALSSLKGFPVKADAQGNVSTRYRVSSRISVPGQGPGAAATPGTAPPVIIQDGGGMVVSATTLPQATLDCTSGDIDPDLWKTIVPTDPGADPGGFTCIIAVGAISDYDRSGGAAIGFEGATFRTFETTTTTPEPAAAAVTSEPPAGDPAASSVPSPAPAPPTQPPPTIVAPPPPPVTPPPSSTTTRPDPEPPPPFDPELTTTTGPP